MDGYDWTTRWVVSEYGRPGAKAHLLPDNRDVWALCWANLGNGRTDNDRPRCKHCERIVAARRFAASTYGTIAMTTKTECG